MGSGACTPHALTADLTTWQTPEAFHLCRTVPGKGATESGASTPPEKVHQTSHQTETSTHVDEATRRRSGREGQERSRGATASSAELPAEDDVSEDGVLNNEFSALRVGSCESVVEEPEAEVPVKKEEQRGGRKTGARGGTQPTAESQCETHSSGGHPRLPLRERRAPDVFEAGSCTEHSRALTESRNTLAVRYP